MKKTIFIYALLFPIIIKAQQQSKHISFYMHGGYKSAVYLKENSHEHLISETETNHHKCIILNAGLQWDISEKWRIGPSFTYDHFGTKLRSVEYSNLSYLLRCDRVWKKTKNYSLYSGLAAGTRKVRKFEDEAEKGRKLVLGYQIYVAGISYKVVNKFSLDVNTGWGVSGILSIGANYRF
jgi:hypothetical protein